MTEFCQDLPTSYIAPYTGDPTPPVAMRHKYKKRDEDFAEPNDIRKTVRFLGKWRHKYGTIAPTASRPTPLKVANMLDFLYLKWMEFKGIFQDIADLDKEKVALLAAHLKVLRALEKTPITSPPSNRYYQGKDTDGPIVDFIIDVYNEHLDGISFGRIELKICDPKAATAINTHEKTYGKVGLDTLNLPTKTQKNDALVAGLTPQQMKAASSTMQSTKRFRYKEVSPA